MKGKKSFMHSTFLDLSSAIREFKEQSTAVPATPTSKTALMFKTISSANSGHLVKSLLMT